VVGGVSHSRGPPRWVQPASAVWWRGRRGPRRGQRRAANSQAATSRSQTEVRGDRGPTGFGKAQAPGPLVKPSDLTGPGGASTSQQGCWTNEGQLPPPPLLVKWSTERLLVGSRLAAGLELPPPPSVRWDAFCLKDSPNPDRVPVGESSDDRNGPWVGKLFGGPVGPKLSPPKLSGGPYLTEVITPEVVGGCGSCLGVLSDRSCHPRSCQGSVSDRSCHPRSCQGGYGGRGFLLD